MNMRQTSLLVLAIAVAPGFVRGGRGQNIAPADLNNLTHQMADRVRHLGEDIASNMGQAPAGNHLIQDTQELAQALDEFHDAEHNTRDLGQTRETYAGIESSWQHLRGQLGRASTPAVNRAASQVEEMDARIRQALGLNAPPPGFYGGPQAPTGIADTQRLAHALVSRADTLAMVVRDEMRGTPNGAALAGDATELARTSDRFHDSIDTNQTVQVAAQAFAPVDVIADRLEQFITANPVSPRLQNAWQAFASVEVLIHQNLGLGSPQPQVPVSLAAPAGGGPPPIVGLANQLADQVNAFVQVYSPTAGVVPDGRTMLAIAQRLQVASAGFQQDAAGGLAPNQLAYEFQDVDALWQQLARRVNRIAKGRVGPNINQVHLIGDTCAQIHQVLAMPGYPPTLNGPAFGP